jgi:hypothetical protein
MSKSLSGVKRVILYELLRLLRIFIENHAALEFRGSLMFEIQKSSLFSVLLFIII